MKIFISVSLVIATLALPSASKAKDKRTTGSFDVIVRSDAFDGTQSLIAGKNGHLANLEFAMPLAVEIDEVPEDIQSQIGGTGASLHKGAVLFSSSRNQNIYCDEMHSRSLGKAGPCLVDVGGHGKFDFSQKANAMAAGAAGMGFSNTWFLGITFGDPVRLSTPIRYHAVAPRFSQSRGTLMWRSNYKSNVPGPVKISFGIVTPNVWQGTAFSSSSFDIFYNGTPVTAHIGGLSVNIHGLNEKGQLLYSLSGKLNDEPIALQFSDRVMSIFYIYH